MLLEIDPKMKKKKGAQYFELDDDLDEAWILEHQAFLVNDKRAKIEKKFQKENEKLAAEGQKEMKAKELTERLTEADDLEKQFKKENKSKKVEPEGKGPTVEKYMAAIEKIDERIAVAQHQAEDKEENKEIALGTSKIVRKPSHGTTYSSEHARTLTPVELHRSPTHGRLRQEVQRWTRQVLLEDVAGEVCMGH